MYEHNVEQVYLLHYNDLYRYLMKLCSDADLVDDLIQNTFLEALKSIEGFRGQSSMKTWLFSIARHQLYRHLRKNKAHIHFDLLSEAELAIKTDFNDKLLAQQILETVNQLDPPQNEIMRLRLIYGLSFKEIAMRVKKTENYCRVNFYRIKEKLRKEYEDEPM